MPAWHATELTEDMAAPSAMILVPVSTLTREQQLRAWGAEPATEPALSTPRKTRTRVAKSKKKSKKAQTFCEGVKKSCRKRGKAKTPFCKSAMKSCRKKGRKGASKGKKRCKFGRVTRGKRKGQCRTSKKR